MAASGWFSSRARAGQLTKQRHAREMGHLVTLLRRFQFSLPNAR
jgi:hypothetical protein